MLFEENTVTFLPDVLYFLFGLASIEICSSSDVSGDWRPLYWGRGRSKEWYNLQVKIFWHVTHVKTLIRIFYLAFISKHIWLDPISRFATLDISSAQIVIEERIEDAGHIKYS